MDRLGVETPLGPVTLCALDGAVVSLDWCEGPTDTRSDVLRQAAVELAEYFAGTRQIFTVPTAPKVSAFQTRFAEVLCAIPFGHTRQYGEIAREMAVPAQAIGQACGANPIPILIPCHRVLAANGLGGFSAKGGVETKVALLRHEGAASLLI